MNSLQELKANKVILKVESKPTVDILSNKAKIPWRILSLMDDCKCMLAIFSEVKIKHILREGNGVVNFLANWGLGYPKGKVITKGNFLE